MGYKKNGTDLICPICGKKFYVKKSHLRRRRYCSLNCRNKGYIGRKLSKEHKESISKSNKGQKRPWAKLNSPFIKGHKGYYGTTVKFEKRLKPWNYIDGRSKNCSPARYGDDWEAIRILIYKRDNYTCQNCGLQMSKKTGAFHIHHIIPFLISFDNSPKNLITLCPSCHRKIEAQIMKKLKMQKVEV